MKREQETFPYIAQLLNGAEVEWKPLGEISSMYGGLTGKNKTDFEEGNASYITYKNIFDNIEIDFSKLEKVKISSSEKQNKVKYGDVLFTGSSETAEEAGMSSAITINIEEDIYLNSFSFGVRFNEDVELLPEFTKYLFRSHFMRKSISKTASGVTRFNISKERFKKIQIPVPPLSVQQEIVRILDKFTQLEAELEAELDCRKRQYEYYRDKLLSFNEVVGGAKTLIFSDLQWKTLGEVADFQNGFAFKSRLFRDNGEVIVRITNIDGKGVDLSDVKYFSISDYNTNMSPYKINKGDILIAMSGATTGKIGFYNYEYTSYLNQRVGKFIPKANILNNRYLYHYLLSKVEEIYIIAGGGAQPNLSSNKLMEKIQIPIPPIEEQERIAGILDKFDTLVNSISEGLPREIELRRKQYEYYREKLLSFPKN